VSITGITEDTDPVGDFTTTDYDGLTLHASLSAALVIGEKLMYSHDNGTTWTDITTSVSGTSVSYTDANLTSTATVQMRVLDAAGNAGSAAVQAITIMHDLTIIGSVALGPVQDGSTMVYAYDESGNLLGSAEVTGSAYKILVPGQGGYTGLVYVIAIVDPIFQTVI
jgi:hypothetical protein